MVDNKEVTEDNRMLMQQKSMEKTVLFAKKGLVVAVFAAMLWGIYGVLMDLAYGLEPLTATGYNILVIPLAACVLEEYAASIILFIRNIKNGKVKEYTRTFRTKPGKIICVGGILGGVLGISGSMAAILYCGPAYALSITALYPVIGALCSVIFLKEKTNIRFWGGFACCIIGGVVIGFTPPEGMASERFYMGIIFAVLACFAWGIEGVLAGFGTDTVDSDVGVGLRVMTAGTTALILLIFIPGGIELLVLCVTRHITTVAAIFCVAIFSALSTAYWYKAFGMTGVSRAMACNSTYGLWSILFSAILSVCGVVDFTLTGYLIAGATIMVIGIVLVVANPRELIQLRKLS